MAKPTEQYEKEILAVVENNKDICFACEIFLNYGGCSERTFYEHKLHESQGIKGLLEQHRSAKKSKMRQNWEKDTAAPGLQVSVYKLMGTDDERKRLSQTYTELSGPGGKPVSVGIQWIGDDGEPENP